MKISFMLKREDFYAINRKTLEKYYADSENEKRLYIYPELNAIVTANPSKAVRQYLYTEFRVNGSFLKRLLVRVYATALLNSRGLFAAKSIRIKTDADKNTLIYPCNKKYRIFDFAKKQVTVVGKDGFPTDDLQHEIAFRVDNRADFIPGLLENGSETYTENIIDGRPLARTGQRMPELCDRAFALWSEYIAPDILKIPAGEYAGMLEQRKLELKEKIDGLGKQVDFAGLDRIWNELLQILRVSDQSVSVGLSHGDLQPGNIWVEDGTDAIYIIDWESWQKRSLWYDRAVLYESLRKTDGIVNYAKSKDLIHATVLLEDIIFRLTELTTLPLDYGCAEFDAYIKML